MPQIQVSQTLPYSYSYKNIAATGTTVVKAAPGTLRAIIVNSALITAAITIYDNTAGSGTVIASYAFAAAVTSPLPAVVYDVVAGTGITIVGATANCNITVIYK